MNGELLLKGYKFPEKIILNLQDKTVLTGEDNFTAFEIFNMLENYFNRKSFSDYYLDKGTTLILNGNKMAGDEFAVFRLRSIVDLSEELKISKKSILGQVMYNVFADTTDKLSIIEDSIQTNVLCHINALTEEYGVSYVYGGNDIFALSKIFMPVVKEGGGQDILQQEHDQFFCKTMLLDFISRLEIKRKKLLLVELPEYGLREEEIAAFLKLLVLAPIDNVIIYTRQSEISHLIPQVFNYNVMKNGKLYGFDDYDELEKQLQDVFNNITEKQIEQKVIEFTFQPIERNCKEDGFGWIVNNFLTK